MALEYAKFIGGAPSYVRALHRYVAVGEFIRIREELDILQNLPNNAVRKSFEFHEKKAEKPATTKKEG